jgi:hypothetical protein
MKINWCLVREAKAFMAFKIAPCKACFKSRPREQSGTVAPQQSLPQRDTPATGTHDLGFDTICCIKPMTISYENQLVSNKRSQSFYGISNNTLQCMF